MIYTVGWADNLQAAVDNASTRAKENHVTVTVTAGKNYLNMGAFSSNITIRQNSEGQVYFDKVDGFFAIADYQWEGPRYKTVSVTGSTTKTKGKGKTKHKGGLGGAVVGTMLAPGVGTLVGYMATRKKIENTKGRAVTKVTESTNEVEVPGNAKMVLRNLSTGESFTISFLCDTKTDGVLANFTMERTLNANEVQQSKDKVTLMKEYKDLLDAGIITQQEFDQKKREILGL